MSRIINRDAVIAAFTTCARLSEQGKPIIFSRLGLAGCSTTAFRKAITNTFTKEKHGIELEKIFNVNKENDHILIRRENTKNPKDIHLIDLIIKAMTIVRREGSSDAPVKAISPVKVNKVINNKKLSVEDLCLELKKRGFIVKLEIK